MAVQRITIAKLGGKPGREVFRMARRWASLRRDQDDDDSIWSSGCWPKKTEREISAFSAQIKARATAPEMLYFCEYIDQWSGGCHMFHWLFHQTKLERRPAIVSCYPLLVFYPLPDRDHLENFLQKCLRSKRIRERRDMERRWFILNLLEAVHAWEELIPASTLVLMRESYTGSPSDPQVKAACARPWASTRVENPQP